MYKKSTLAFATALLIAGSVQAQNWINDTIETGTNYSSNIYYSLADGITGSAAADNWHLGLSVDRFSETIITNSADKGVKIYEISADTSDFGTDLNAALTTQISTHPMSFYNSNLTWNKGALNYASLPLYGWANYDMNTHWLNGGVVFGFITGTDTLQLFVKEKQTTPSNNSPIYIVQTAKMDGSNQQTYTINASASNGRNFTYMNIMDGTSIEREPLRENWDFVFSNYNDSTVVFQNAQYKVFGILTNNNIAVARVDTPSSEYDNIDYNNVSNYDTAITAIGKDWKVSGQGGTYLQDSVTYFIKIKNGDIWQVVFNQFKTGADTVNPGLVAFKKRLVHKASTSVKDVNGNVASFVIAPNPSTNIANILIDAEKALGDIQINIIDFNGRIVKQLTTSVSNGFHQIPINVNNFANGIYLLNIQGKGINKTLKLVKQ
ncbi:MAG TPA: T9SS type A sorting domain-containing protein [Edaphocola sp.]|nr:T9SS type A sorting domain-containing protein [Edaphocola sp.]